MAQSSKELAKEERGLYSPASQFEMLVRRYYTNFFAALSEHAVESIRIKVTEYGGFFIVARRFGDDGGLEVAFGEAHELGTLMGAINAIFARGKWRPNRTWKGGQEAPGS